MLATTEADIGEGRMDMEWHVPQPIWQSKENSQKDAYLKFHDTSRPLHLEIEASDVSLGARLLQIRDGMNCGHDKMSSMKHSA